MFLCLDYKILSMLNYKLPNNPLRAPTIPKTIQAVLTLQQQQVLSVLRLKISMFLVRAACWIILL